MNSLLWHLVSRTAESQFIFNLFHLLLAGLTLLVLLHQFRTKRASVGVPDRLMPVAFALLVLNFALLTIHFGSEFFLRRDWNWNGLERLPHGLMATGLLLALVSLANEEPDWNSDLIHWILRGCLVVVGLSLGDILLWSLAPPTGQRLHAMTLMIIDLLVVASIAFGIRAVIGGQEKSRWVSSTGFLLAGLALLLHSASFFTQVRAALLLWNAEQHLYSMSLFAFAWWAGERSRHLLDRVFVRLNLTFIILASLIMLVTVGMEKYQYLRLAEERSMNLAEFLRGHLVYYGGRGESLEKIFKRPEVLRRVVVEFGTLPELREVNIYLDRQRASFRNSGNGEIKEEIVSSTAVDASEAGEDLPNRFQMIRLPVETGSRRDNHIEFLGTMDFINEYLGKYIILIYLLFTIMVGLASTIIGIIVADTDRRLRQQFAELQEAHEQLAHAAKLATIGELAGGMAHEINTPITSILSLATHLPAERSADRLTAVQRKSLEVIATQAQRVSKIVGNLLTLARQSHLELNRLDVAALLETAVTLVQHRLRNGTIRLDREVQPDLPRVLGDAERLTAVFVNLLNNAIDAMPQGGTLTVRLFTNSEPDGEVRLEVRDTGGGIRAEHLPRIFDPFFTTKETGRGTGLGLSISHGIVKDHAGRIWAESQPGLGTTLVVTLPKEVSSDERPYSRD